MPTTVLVYVDVRPDSALDTFKAALPSPDFDVRYFPRKGDDVQEPTEEELKEVDVLVAFEFPKGVTSIEQIPRLKLFQLCSAGSNHVDSHPLMESLPSDHPLILSSASGIHVTTISEHVVSSVMAMFHGFPRFIRAQADSHWTPHTDLHRDGFAVRELRGQTMGILGYGHIGRETARMAKALGMNVITATRSGEKSPIGGYLIDGTGDHEGDIPSRWHATSSTSDLHTFYSTSDVVVNTLPSSKHTQRFVDEAAFRSMKPDAIYVNIGRGDTTDQGKLIEALEAGLKKSSGQEGELRIGGASLDVTTPEPLEKDSKLWSLSNVLLTPHMSGLSSTYFVRALDVARINTLRVCVEGKGALNAVRGKGE